MRICTWPYPSNFLNRQLLVSMHIILRSTLPKQKVHLLFNHQAQAISDMLTADITTLKQALQMLSEFMRQSGIGALPLIPLPTESGHPVTPAITEETILADITRNVGVLYKRMKSSQDSAAIVVSLMGVAEGSGAKTQVGR